MLIGAHALLANGGVMAAVGAQLVALAARSPAVEPLLTALVITGLVITVAFTGVGAVLVRRIEAHEEGRA